MCRLLGYLGPSILLDYLLYKPEHSLIVQSYQPQEMTAGLLNADGFGIGWYHPQRETDPFTYKNILPIWNDINLPQLSRYIESGCIIANVRSATPGQAVDLNNCQPFQAGKILGIHNGYIENFRFSIYKKMRSLLNEKAYQLINGTTDSEHIFALVINELVENQTNQKHSLFSATRTALNILADLAASHQIAISANLILTDGHQLIATRFAVDTAIPSLYWLRDETTLPSAALIASEPIFPGNWNRCPENSLITIGENLELNIYPL